MKSLKNVQVENKDGKVTITADVVELPFNEMLVSRVTHGYLNPELHPQTQFFPRHIQSSNAAVFVRYGATGFFIANDDLIKIAAFSAPETSFAPVFKQGTIPPKVEVVSELPVSFKWEISDEAFPKATQQNTPPPAAVWTGIPGQTSNVLDESEIPSGKWIRCIASNASGSTTSKPAKKQ